MKKYLLLFLMPMGTKAQIAITKNAVTETASGYQNCRVVRTPLPASLGSDTSYVITYVNSVAPHNIQMVAAGSRSEAHSILELIMKMYKGHNHADSYSINTATGTVMLFWSQNSVVLTSPNFPHKDGIWVVTYEAAKHLNQF